MIASAYSPCSHCNGVGLVHPERVADPRAELTPPAAGKSSYAFVPVSCPTCGGDGWVPPASTAAARERAAAHAHGHEP